MARNDIHIAATPAQVFDVLSDPRSYAYWVVGSKAVRGADPHWPERGSRFHHSVGIGPLSIRDHTVVEEVEPGAMLQLHAKARPFGTARVKLLLDREGTGTRVTMIEDAGDRLSALLFMPLTHLLVRGRNDKSLQRLRELAEAPPTKRRRMAAAAA